MSKETKIEIKSLTIEGRNAVLEAFRSGKTGRISYLSLMDVRTDRSARLFVRQKSTIRS